MNVVWSFFFLFCLFWSGKLELWLHVMDIKSGLTFKLEKKNTKTHLLTFYISCNRSSENMYIADWLCWIHLIFFSGWFGIRKDFCQFLLGVCPCLQEYGNISYSAQSSSDTMTSDTSSVSTNRDKPKQKHIEDQHKIVMPIVSIDMPDWGLTVT